jgi:hypothetical protein
VNQNAIAWFDLSGAVQHLICSDVVQHKADGFTGVQPGRHRNQFPLGETNELGVRAAYRHGRD